MFFKFSRAAKAFIPAKNGDFVKVGNAYISRNCAGHTRTTLPSAGEPRTPKPITGATGIDCTLHFGKGIKRGENGQLVEVAPPSENPTIGPAFAAALAAAKPRTTTKKEDKAAKSAAYWQRVAENKAARDAAKAQRAKERAEITARREQEKQEAAALLAAAIASERAPLTSSNRAFQKGVFMGLKAQNAARYAGTFSGR